MIIRPIGQSGYVIKSGQTEIIIDPYLSDIVNKVAGRERMLPSPIDPAAITADAVICTHDHLDHLDTESAAKMREEQFFITTHEGAQTLKELGKKKVSIAEIGTVFTIGDLTLKAVFADHSCEAFGLIVKDKNFTLYFSGDTLYNEKLFEIAAEKPDITFICINGRLGNMTVEEAVITARRIGAKVNIPNHYDMFASNTEDPAKFTAPNAKILEFDQEYEVKDLLK